MNNFNKVLSFILGLVVVIVFFAVLTGRINLRSRLPFLNTKAELTPTPKIKITPTPISSVTVSNNFSTTSSNQSTMSYNRYQTSTKTPSTIPSTGSPTLLLPLFFSTLGVGIYLKKKS